MITTRRPGSHTAAAVLAANRGESSVESVVVYGTERALLFDVMPGRR